MAFSWEHISASFHMTSADIFYMMKELKTALFTYVDDFILVSEADDTMHHFNKLASLFSELGLPISTKYSPHMPGHYY